jgi:DNA-binding transcriptional LysR family regulator
MNIQQLLIFVSVEKHSNLTRVSEVLHISQPSITRSLKMLEEELQVKLYDWKGRGVQLTEVGKRFSVDANLILTQFENLKNKFSKATVAFKDQSLVVGGSHGPSAGLLPSVLATFNQQHPGVRLTIRTDRKRVLEKLILKGQIDLAVVTRPPLSPEIMGETYRKEKFVLFAPTEHPLTRGKNLTAADLAQVPLIIRQAVIGRGAIQAILNQLESCSLKPNIVLRCDSSDSVKTAVRRKMGLGVLHIDALESDIKTGEFKIIDVSGIKFEAESFVIYQKQALLSVHALEFLDLLRKSTDKSPARVSRRRLSAELHAL